MTKWVPSDASPATYSVDAVATDPTSSKEGTANLTVVPPLVPITVSLSVPSGPFKINSTVTARSLAFGLKSRLILGFCHTCVTFRIVRLTNCN